MNSRRFCLACLVLPLVFFVGLGGCPFGEPQPEPEPEPEPQADGEEALRVNFDASGGNYAVATDKEGNQYTFRAREEADGTTTITEANILTADGKELKVSLDSSGRPVNVRLSDNTAADLVYDATGGTVDIRVTDAQGNEVASAKGLNAKSRKEFVQERRRQNFAKADARFQAKSKKVETLQEGLETCEEVVESIVDEASNPDSPLADSSLKSGLQRIGEVASTAEVEETDEREDLGEDVTIDEIPEVIQALAGRTFKLFDAEGFCLEYTDVANRLTFDNNGILQTEFDRNLVFPDFSVNAEESVQDPGITINYASSTPVNLTPDEEVGFTLWVTPVFTGTQLDDNGKITIERRFLADLEFEVDMFAGATTAEAHQLFDVAFINGELKDLDNDDEGLLETLELDLIMVDLNEENPVGTFGTLRYHDQNVRAPERVYACEYDPGQEEEEDPERGISCPEEAKELGDEFTLTFNPGEADPDAFDYDWFISDGEAYIFVSDDGLEATVMPTEEGFLEITLLLHDLSDDPEVVGVYTCTVNVGQDPDEDPEVPDEDELNGYCPEVMVVGVEVECWVEGPLLQDLDYYEWYILGTWSYWIEYPVMSSRTTIAIYEPGCFEVAFAAWTNDGEYIYLWQEVEVVEEGETEWGEEELPEDVDFSEFVGSYYGVFDAPDQDWEHEFYFNIDEDGLLVGTSEWVWYGQFVLAGYVDEEGYIYFEDDGFGVYEGWWESDGFFYGEYYEDWDYIGDWAAAPVGGA